MNNNSIVFLDCTLRDGGYYNSWNFSRELISSYLGAMASAGINVAELGLRSLKSEGFKGACAYTTDEFINSFEIPKGLLVSVMVNASELVGESDSLEEVLGKLFPSDAKNSPVDLVRIACHVHEFSKALPAVCWLKSKGFLVGFNLMQVAGREQAEIEALASQANDYPIDVLYFADSMGGMSPDQIAEMVNWLRAKWKGPLGIHTHDNMGLALSNTLRALDEGVTWVDATVTGMGRGPGNARSEELIIEVAERQAHAVNLVPLMALVCKYFRPMQINYGWGTNPYYYLAGKYKIHPTYIQEMLNDARYDEEDILAVIEHLRYEGGKKFSFNTLDTARHFYRGSSHGAWSPKEVFRGREVLLLGTGPGVGEHRQALEAYIRKKKPLVIALNTQRSIDAGCIDFRVACHPVRLLADCHEHVSLPQPLITPFSMLPDDVKRSLSGKKILDFGLDMNEQEFGFHETSCSLPEFLVVAYALAVSASGEAERILMAGFDGYPGEDPRNKDTNKLFNLYKNSSGAVPLLCVTPTRYDIPTSSIYGISQ